MNVFKRSTLFHIIFAVAVFFSIEIRHYDMCMLFFCLALTVRFVIRRRDEKTKRFLTYDNVVNAIVDKFLIGGAFIYLVAVPEMRGGSFVPDWQMLRPWMVIVIVGCESLILSLRVDDEEADSDFSAQWVGKWRRGIQCTTIMASFLYLAGHANDEMSIWVLSLERLGLCMSYSPPSFIVSQIDCFLPAVFFRSVVLYTMLAALWLALFISLYSGFSHVTNAVRMIRSNPA